MTMCEKIAGQPRHEAPRGQGGDSVRIVLWGPSCKDTGTILPSMMFGPGGLYRTLPASIFLNPLAKHCVSRIVFTRIGRLLKYVVQPTLCNALLLLEGGLDI